MTEVVWGLTRGGWPSNMPGMIYRRFGATGLQMPVFSCGGMRYQHKWGDVPPSEIPADGQANLEATIHRALEVGINHIETARGYGSSEMQLGRVLPTIKRDRLIVQTKVAPSPDPKEFLATFNKSMEMLRLDYVDLLGMHGINTTELLEQTVRPGGCMDVARQLQKEGRVRFIGFSTHASRDVIIQAIRHKDEQGRGFDYVNLHWYYIYQRNWDAVVEATKHDMGVFIISPADKGGKLYAPPPKLATLTRPLHPMVFNDLFCLSRPEVHTLSVGAARPSDFDAHLETLPLLSRAAEVLKPIEAALAEAMREATGVDHPEALSWDLPEHEAAPGGMNLPIIVWLRNLALGWDMGDYGKMRYNLLGSGGHWFPGANASKLDELGNGELARAASGSKLGARLEEVLREAHSLMGGESVKRLSRSE